MKAPVWVICKINKVVLYSGTKKECLSFIDKYSSMLNEYNLKLW